jgi:hypothetical protein
MSRNMPVQTERGGGGVSLPILDPTLEGDGW